jgi:hypothetical protein
VPPAPAPAAPVAPAGPATPGAQTTSPSAGPRAIAGTPVTGGSASTSGSAPSGSPAALAPLSLTVRRSGALLAVRGRLTTRREVRLALQRRSGGRYRTVSVLRVRPGRDGRFARRLRVTRSGVYKVRASATGARTATRTLRVSVRR